MLSWQAEAKPDEWTPVATGAAFTPGDAEVGSRLRVVATFRDFDGVLESVTSPADGGRRERQRRAHGRAGARRPHAHGGPGGHRGHRLDRGPRRAGGRHLPAPVAAGRRRRLGEHPGGDRGQVHAGRGRGRAAAAGRGDVHRQRRHRGAGAVGGDRRGHRGAGAAGARRRRRRPAGAGRRRRRRPAPAAPLALERAVLPRTLAAPALVANGLPVRFAAPAGTRVVRVEIVRAGSDRTLARVFVRARAGRTSLLLRQRAITRALRRGGRFRVELTPGTSRGKLGVTTVKKITSVARPPTRQERCGPRAGRMRSRGRPTACGQASPRMRPPGLPASVRARWRVRSSILCESAGGPACTSTPNGMGTALVKGSESRLGSGVPAGRPSRNRAPASCVSSYSAGAAGRQTSGHGEAPGPVAASASIALRAVMLVDVAPAEASRSRPKRSA